MNAFFKILTDHTYKGKATHPSTIPWDLVAPFEAQAMKNHGGQTLEKLNQRGGLTVVELWHVMNSSTRHLRYRTHEEACEWLENTLNEGKLTTKGERTGHLLVLDFEITFPVLITDLAHNEEKNKSWLFKNKGFLLIDVHELIIQHCFGDTYFGKIYDALDELLSYRWKTASHLRLKLI